VADASVSPGVRLAVATARGGFVIPAMPPQLSAAEQGQSRAIIAASLVDTVDTVLWVAAALALASALVTALTIKTVRREPAPPAPPEPTTEP
jgi:hypothetical protein